MAQRTAERHAARLKAIQDAQEEAASAAAAAAESANAASTSAAPPPAAREPEVEMTESQEDEYHFPSEDDALYAAVDLGALDEGIGRPIDFEDGEGAGAAMEQESQASSVDVPLRQDAPARLNRRATEGANAPHGAPSRAPQPGPAQLQPSPVTLANQDAGFLRQANPSSSSASTSSASGSRERPRTPSMGGGFNFPAGQQSSRGQPPPRSTSHTGVSASTGSGTSSSLKRTAEIMQGIQSARRAQQGMGLQNPAGGSGAQPPGGRREPFAALEVGEGGDVKRVRRQ
ncbi:hypothetical protein BD309DRAFT_867164 [Dichomitus squalens]|uniref:Uncharacterized protein n=1 Tax=Dichomitus squalens TaxID=114155 RepID=A0A4Q9NKY5_9APHY|nr:hypothetical protein BD309DRAFT_867164 [Dichomitus squalens]TBU60367.1 hypothetical protein BD310DRAFT_947334 [Dichomitus squalens]